MPDKFSALSESQVAKKIKESANQIWLAGLGAYSKAEQEGSKIFDSLVNDGESIENKTRGREEDTLRSTKERVGGMRERATGSWEKIEKAFDERVSKALGRLHIPTKKDVDDLSERIEALNVAIQALAVAKTEQAKKRPTKATATGKKTVEKKTVEKKTAD
ncbi:MAG: phasin family protein [Pseudomonadales bacterium]|nr:phasin family protein [Pseudomonadales bacterium]